MDTMVCPLGSMRPQLPARVVRCYKDFEGMYQGRKYEFQRVSHWTLLAIPGQGHPHLY